MCAGTAPSTTATTNAASSTVIDSAQRQLNPSTKPTTSHLVCNESSTDVVFPDSWMPTATAASARPIVRTARTPCGPRLTASTVHAATCPTAVAVAIQTSMPISAGARERISTPYAVAPSRTQAWMSQAMLSGASRKAPRWSVVGLTGYATACSRLSSSRPPPEATADATARTSSPAIAAGSRTTASRA